MANFHIPLNVCCQLQTELAAITPNHRQPGLAFLQSEVNCFLLQQSVLASNKNKKASQSTGKKGSNRNDSRKRKQPHVPEEEVEVTRPGKAVVREEEEEEEEEGPQGEVAIGGERNHESEVEDQRDNPVPERVRKPKTKAWETVDNLQTLTSPGAKFLQHLGVIAEQGRINALMSLEDNLSLLTTSDIPQTTSLELIIKRCMVTSVQVIEDHFCHLIALMQLVLWLDQ